MDKVIQWSQLTFDSIRNKLVRTVEWFYPRYTYMHLLLSIWKWPANSMVPCCLLAENLFWQSYPGPLCDCWQYPCSVSVLSGILVNVVLWEQDLVDGWRLYIYMYIYIYNILIQFRNFEVILRQVIIYRYFIFVIQKTIRIYSQLRFRFLV